MGQIIESADLFDLVITLHSVDQVRLDHCGMVNREVEFGPDRDLDLSSTFCLRYFLSSTELHEISYIQLCSLTLCLPLSEGARTECQNLLDTRYIQGMSSWIAALALTLPPFR